MHVILILNAKPPTTYIITHSLSSAFVALIPISANVLYFTPGVPGPGELVADDGGNGWFIDGGEFV
jgi:hypothetical protein